ncbi:MAG: glutamate--tRNA ligase [Bacteroidia bacterium]|nr:glutamate--tRNA ligase [Bacteroidia bacterium]
MSVRVRFAPSPTGPLHIGGVRTALYNYLFARHHGGEFLLRIEDTDQTRYVPGAEAYIVEALEWLGIRFDHGPHLDNAHPKYGPFRQSERKPIYRQYVEQLIANDNAYYAFDTEEELEAMRSRAEAAGMKNWQYNAITRESMHNSLTLPADEVARRLAAGAAYVVRMKIPRNEEIRFQDAVRGWVTVSTNTLDDKVLLKSDGMPTYHLANIVDDRLMEITHVIRGEEWLPSTPLHVLLYQAFGWDPPAFSHLPLLLKPDGNGKLSKRDGDQLGFPVFPLQWQDPTTGEISSGYREKGYLPEAVINFLALLGWSPGHDEELMTLARMIEVFSLERVGKSGVKFDYQKGLFFQQTYLRQRPVASFVPQVQALLAQEDLPIPPDERLVAALELLRERATFVYDFVAQGRFFFEVPRSYDPEVAQKKWSAAAQTVLGALAQDYRSATQWDAAYAEARFKALAEAHQQKPGSLMPALRLALTGLGTGPGLWDIMVLLGPPATAERLEAAVATLPVPQSA